jgi:N utilization substance protein B
VTTRRRKARESAVEALYRCDLLQDDPHDTVEDILKRRRLPLRAADYCRALVEQTLAAKPEIDAILSATLFRWKLDRLSYMDRAILRMACCEILHFDDVPTTVSINEAVELAKLFGDDRSAQFVNGVLDAIARQHPKPTQET